MGKKINRKNRKGGCVGRPAKKRDESSDSEPSVGFEDSIDFAFASLQENDK
jgi:hypothetical protein